MQIITCAVSLIREVAKRDPKPWLVVGKGPSFDHRGAVEAAAYHHLTLNHVARIYPQPCGSSTPYHLAHFTDLEALAATLPDLDPQRTTLVLPWYPHQNCHVGRTPLPECLAGLQGAAAFRVVSYNSTLARKLKQKSSLARVRVRLFSAVAAVNLLAEAGVRTIRLLGVDGGTAYASCFDDADRLRNGQKSFDVQWAEVYRAVHRYGIDLKHIKHLDDARTPGARHE